MARKSDKLVLLIKDYQATFSGEAGTNVLFDLVRRSEILNSTVKDFDPHRLAFNEGRRSIILYILTQLDTDPQAFAKMLKDMADAEVGDF